MMIATTIFVGNHERSDDNFWRGGYLEENFDE